MARKLITVDDSFYIEGHGLCLTPVLVPQDDEIFRRGDLIDIKIPNYQVTRTSIQIIQTTITDLDLPTPNPKHGWIIMIPASFRKEDVPVGSEVWSVDS